MIVQQNTLEGPLVQTLVASKQTSLTGLKNMTDNELTNRV